ncbi:MAG TPA: O-antigen ligase family protein, partial [Planctomycetota bacterium]|nr:O-antigen ligase family protein [Planctomycetota bacterium]
VGAVAGLSVAVLAGGVLLFPRFAGMSEQGSDNFRKRVWQRGWDDFVRSPAIGVGFGRFNDADRQFTAIGIGEIVRKARPVNSDFHAHNSYLHWMAEGGLVGLAVMVLYWALAVRRLDGRDVVLRNWVIVAVVAMAVMCLTEHYAGGGVFLMHLSFLIGLNQSRAEEPEA